MLQFLLDGLVYVLALLGGVMSGWELFRRFNEWREHRIDTFASIEKNALKLLDQVDADEFNPTVVIGIGRSGAFLGGWLAGNLGSLPISVFERRFKADKGGPPDFADFERNVETLDELFTDKKTALVVQGASTSGSTLREFEQKRQQFMPDWEVKYCVLYNVDTAAFPVDYVAKVLKVAPKKFPWHKRAAYKKYMRIKRVS